MKKINFLWTALLIGVMSFAQNLVVNGDMESWDDPNTPTGWTHVENAAQSTNAHSGTYSVQHTGGTSDLAQTISGIIPGKTYTVSLWYQHETGTGDGEDLRIWSFWKAGNATLSDNADELRGPNNSYLDNNNGEWTQYSVTLTAPATADNFYFEVRTYGGAVVYYDDFSFTCLDCQAAFDCPELSANIGESCDDGDANTVNDVVTEDCGCEGTEIVVGDECGFENFDNAELTSSYSDGSFVGENGIIWVYGHSRDQDNFGIDGNGIMLRNASDSYLEATIPNGIGEFTFQYRKAFTGGSSRQLELLVNGAVVETSEGFGSVSGADATVYTFTHAVNMEGEVTIRIKNVGTTTTNRQTVIDNISWTCYGDEEPVEYDCPALEANFGDTCDDGNEMTENDIINENCECEGTPVVVFDCPELEAYIGDTCDDGNPNTINDVIGEDCECAGEPIVVGDECGFENFDNAELTSTYSNGSFVGNDGITWTYTDARDKGNTSGVDGNALMWRTLEGDYTTNIISSTISGGVSSFSVKLYKAFTGGGERKVELFINGTSYGESSPFDDNDEHIFNVDNINVAGDFVLEIKNTGRQIVIDDITWTCYGDEEPVEYDCPALESNFGDACDDGDDMTENDMINENCECEGTPIITYDCPELEANFGDACDDGDDMTENDMINENCECEGTPVQTSDADGDGVADDVDNCPNTYNPDQADGNGDGIGDACEECDLPYMVVLNRTSPTTATFNAGNSVWHYQGSANRAGRPLRPYPMYGMNDMTVPHTQYALVPAFDYDVWIRTICEDGTFSPWAGPFYLPTYEDASRRTPDMTLSPNPAVAMVSISKVDARTIEVFDMNGSHIKTFNTKDSQFDITGLPTGKYNLRVIDAEGNVHFDQVIKK